jgi:hypothetical protein
MINPAVAVSLPAFPTRKRCCRCQIFKDRTEFYRDRSRVDGVEPCCTACARIRQREAKNVGKVCCKCKERKNKDQFYRDRSRKDGREPHCIPCASIASAKKYLARRPKKKYFNRPGGKKFLT